MRRRSRHPEPEQQDEPERQERAGAGAEGAIIEADDEPHERHIARKGQPGGAIGIGQLWREEEINGNGDECDGDRHGQRALGSIRVNRKAPQRLPAAVAATAGNIGRISTRPRRQ